jgi:hypothetical protein
MKNYKEELRRCLVIQNGAASSIKREPLMQKGAKYLLRL